MFDLFKKSKASSNAPEIEDDESDEENIVIWERYNTKTGEVEDILELECYDEDGLEAMETLTDVKKPNGEWQGYRYVYISNGVEKHIRPKDNRYP
ncbi:MAG: hypothetical protein PHF01_00215 [Methanocorpusculum sp.]|jgi:hypothetical protein|uniref:DUF4178 domain-containing protein n=1 Tax=Methanocorpusculum parvum TaxID=2193 RepID=A0AAX0Q6S9_9EURY|nr:MULTISPECIES: hypothetical protein [Methanocorpusculum]MDD2248765.1 hypothetical protein [Methanocorpusculum sp.]MDD2802843.1 hypothetical protein [Methanocorpusculum sp.]MDD3046775.1 hypothetical protein [Methanocorpusculum sp.]MDD3911915.1 hypothetical protein [Methanocorpusculum sp.]MDD4423395.1 hypothetical protein [Methanocorpusculum parvum]